jgi:hypothetical protein
MIMMQVLLPGHGSAQDDALMRQGVHFNYNTQKWVTGHDHAHFEHDNSPLSFCGSDSETCRTGHPEQW